jgi:hypothetical protein
LEFRPISSFWGSVDLAPDAERLLGRLYAELTYLDIREALADLHIYLDDMQRKLNAVGESIAVAKLNAYRGVKLGTPKPEKSSFADPALAGAAGIKGGEVRLAAANDFAKLIGPLLKGELAGLSANAQAAELNHRGVQTPRGGRWTARSRKSAQCLR